MRMSGSLTRRLQVLVDEERFARLRRESKRTGAPVGAIVREAIDARLPAVHEPDQLGAAAGRLLSAEPMPVEDWDVEKGRLLDELYGPGGSGAP